MSDDFLGERRHALEEKFFHHQQAQLLERLRKQHEMENAQVQLKAATGIEDDKVLEEVARLGIRSETLVCLSLIPLLQVAWADRRMEPEERKAVLAAADARGLKPHTPAFELLESWLDEAPPTDLLTAWADYIKALAGKMNRTELDKLKADIVGRARGVAEATGGYFGLGKISKPEQEVLDQIAKAFG